MDAAGEGEDEAPTARPARKRTAKARVEKAEETAAPAEEA
jgi:hypothetical protein